MKMLLQLAPNLSELFIGFDNLLAMFDDDEICRLLGHRIVHLLLLRSVPTAPTHINDAYLPVLVRTFTRLRHLQIDVTHGPTIDSVIVAILNASQLRSQLISLVIEGQCSCETLKCNARQWLIDRAYFQVNDRFDAEFKQQTNRFLLWT
jgi:hypothetical protein